ncbi:MAG: hypothetical protein AUH72_07810 [Acidobacteria bacterium 13_1_40CM_4_65_8]|nr:MAG: hypothetical protein AUH72_07810 [Acidobacteria bacterium 13_1_40CM_4_65_8]
MDHSESANRWAWPGVGYLPAPLKEKHVMKSTLSVALGSLLIVLTALLDPGLATAQQFSDWSSPTNVNAMVRGDGTPCPAVVNSTADDQHMTISKDGLSLIFSSNRPGGSGGQDLWVTARGSRDDCWGEPANLGNVVNSAVMDLAPNLTTDGHWLYFHSRRPGGCGGGTSGELWVSRRQDKRDNFGWETPVNLGCAINLEGIDQAGPNHFEDEASGTQFLYFTRKPSSATEDFFDIYVSTCNADLATCNLQGLWSVGEPVAALNSPPDPAHGFGRDTRTAIRRRDGLEMILSSKRAPGLIDLWTSTRATTLDQNWSVPRNLSVLNSSANDGAPAISWDGTELYFYSNRTGVLGATGGNDLYVSTRGR